MSSFSPVYARRTLLVSLVSVGMGFTVLFPVLAPLGREIGLSEFQITSIIAASSLTVSTVTVAPVPMTAPPMTEANAVPVPRSMSARVTVTT